MIGTVRCIFLDPGFGYLSAGGVPWSFRYFSASLANQSVAALVIELTGLFLLPWVTGYCTVVIFFWGGCSGVVGDCAYIEDYTTFESSPAMAPYWRTCSGRSLMGGLICSKTQRVKY